jgi:hypothetical protein
MDSKQRCPSFDRLTMRAKPLKTRGLILSLSKDEAKISCFSKNSAPEPTSSPYQATDLALARSSAASADLEAKSFQALSSAIARHFAMSSAEKSTTAAPFPA